MSLADHTTISCSYARERIAHGLEALLAMEQARVRAHLLSCEICAAELWSATRGTEASGPEPTGTPIPGMEFYEAYLKCGSVVPAQLSPSGMQRLQEWLTSHIIPPSPQPVPVYAADDMPLVEARVAEPGPGEPGTAQVMVGAEIDERQQLHVRVRTTDERLSRGYRAEVGLRGEERPIALAWVRISKSEGETTTSLPLAGLPPGQLPAEELYVLLTREAEGT
ncbi:MAG: hypothetical protein FJX75_20055 [Armatimonadetes bacterium]|nr:hypothetical protein [Armatimonadota bacterium]